MASPKKGRQSITVIDPDTLTPEDKASLRTRAAKAVDDEVRQATIDSMYAQFLLEERRRRIPDEETKYIQLDLASHSDRIMIDGVVYFHGVQYAVPRSLYNVLRETVQAGWRHEAETEGHLNRNAYRKRTERRIGAPATAGH